MTQKKSFSHLATVPTSQATLSLDDLGPPGIKGQIYVVANVLGETRSNEERLTDTKSRTFKVAARLGKVPLPTGDMKGDFDLNDGSSYLRLLANSEKNRVACQDGVFEMRVNQQGELSLIEFNCVAASVHEAKEIFVRAALPFLDLQSFLANSPLFVTSIRIEDIENKCTVLDYTSPYREVVIPPQVHALRTELAPVYALYRDAKNSHSAFYSFLCYHKILEGLLGNIRARLRTRAAKQKIDLSRREEVVPDHEFIDPVFREHIGKSIKAFYDHVMTPRFRDAVAHFISKDGNVLNLSSLAEAERYSSILYISELCVRKVIDNHETWLDEMVVGSIEPGSK